MLELDQDQVMTKKLPAAISPIIDYQNEKISQTVDLHPQQTSQVIPGRLSGQSKRRNSVSPQIFPSNKSSESESGSTSESSDPVVRAGQHQNVLDKQLVVWLSNSGMRTRFGSKSSYKLDAGSSQSFDKPKGSIENVDGYENSEEETEIKGRIVIEFINVWKKFHKTYVVRNFSLQVYENQLMVLLGHNAAGKTTIFNMTCGRTLPSYGSILINGHSVVNHPVRALQHVGISLQSLNIFTEFTFTEQLTYICRLRGLTLLQATNDITDYLNTLHAENLAQLPVQQLTIGHRRLLQVLCAFAGRTKIVLLDRPMEGVDAEQRRHFYIFINRERIKRTILITTNYPHVASNLGDRIAILISGRLFACGLEKSLMHQNRHAYRLVSEPR